MAWRTAGRAKQADKTADGAMGYTMANQQQNETPDFLSTKEEMLDSATVNAMRAAGFSEAEILRALDVNKAKQTRTRG